VTVITNINNNINSFIYKCKKLTEFSPLTLYCTNKGWVHASLLLLPCNDSVCIWKCGSTSDMLMFQGNLFCVPMVCYAQYRRKMCLVPI